MMHRKRLSIKKIYGGAGLYIARHPFAFIFLTIFYFLGSLLPMLLSSSPFAILFVLYYYLFLYYAAGFYYKKQILSDKSTFYAAGIRFIMTVLLFLAVILLSTFAINLVLDGIRTSVIGGHAVVYMILHNHLWLIVRYLFIFVLVVVFFVVPSFAFISEITGKSRSILATYVKTKGNMLRIAVIVALCYCCMLLVLLAFYKANLFVTTFARALIMVYITFVYFKMYDFFYMSEQVKKENSNTPKVKDNDYTRGLKYIAQKIRGSFAQVSANKQGGDDVNQG